MSNPLEPGHFEYQAITLFPDGRSPLVRTDVHDFRYKGLSPWRIVNKWNAQASATINTNVPVHMYIVTRVNDDFY